MNNSDLTGKLDRVVAAIGDHEMRLELEALHRYHEQAIRLTGFAVGDRVALRDDYRITYRGSGYWCYRECLVPGAPATVAEITFNKFSGQWQALVKFDAEWSVHEGERRYDALIECNGKTADERHLFSFDIDELRHATADDVAPAMPIAADLDSSSGVPL